MMRVSKGSRLSRVAALTAALVLFGLPAFAARLVGAQVSGVITAITSNVSVSINGKQYMIAAGSSAAQAIQGLHVGDQVGLILDGPVSQSGAHVLAIQTAAKR